MAVGIRSQVGLAVFAFAALTCQELSAGDVVVRAQVRAESLTVGDRFLYTNRVEAERGLSIRPLPLGEMLGDALVLSNIYELEPATTGSHVYACTLAVFRPGKAEIPSFTFVVADSSGKTREVNGDTLTVTIQSVLPPDTAGLEIADIRGPYRLKGPIWPYLLIPLAIGLLALVGLKMRRLARSRVEIPSVPEAPPWETALQRLDSLRDQRHIDFGRYKQFYFELSLIIRAYIEQLYHIPAVESTTYELEGRIALEQIQIASSKGLFELFRRADLVKFAKHIPSAQQAEADLSFAYDFIRETKIATEAVATQPAEEVKA